MKDKRQGFEGLGKRIKELEKGVKSQKKALDIQKCLVDQKTRELESFRLTADVLELYLDEDWHIIGNSNNLALLTENIVGLRKRGEHVRSFLKEVDFEKIQEYLNKLDAIKNLPFEQGRKWKLRYRGPSDSETIGRDWLPFSFSGINQWKIKNGKIIHKPVREKEEDCYLMTTAEYGGADEDLKVIFKARTLKNKDLIRDLSLVLSGASSGAGIHPDLAGYTACSGSNGNTEGRIQKKGGNLIVVYEELEPDTEYQITVERTGGKLSREIINLKTGAQGHLLEVIDTDVVYDRQNYLGFTTFAGEAEFYDLKIYTRKSIFTVDQFRVPFNSEVGINDEKIKDKVFKLRIGKEEIGGKTRHMLLFEDVTEHKRVEEALSKSKERYRDLVENLNDVVYSTDNKGVITYISPVIESLSGYSTKEIIGRSYTDFIHKGDLPRIAEMFQKVISGHPEPSEYRIITKAGEFRWVRTSSKPIFKEGQCIGLRGILADITGQKRTEEALGHLVEMERLILYISTDFTNLSLDELGPGVNRAIRMTGEFFGVDHSYVILLSEDGKRLGAVHEWCARGMKPQIDSLKGLSVEAIPWLIERLQRLENIHIPRLSDLPPEASVEKKYLQEQAIKSILLVPMISGRSLVGFLGFDSVKSEKTWLAEDIESLITIGDLFVNTLERKKAEEALKYRAEFERVISNISTDFINLTSSEIDSGISRALQAIGEFAGIDRSYVFQYYNNGTMMDNTHEWCKEGIGPQIQRLKGMPVEIFPWFLEIIKRLDTVYIPKVRNLPPEASAEKKEFQEEGIRSLVAVPLVSSGVSIGFFGFDSVLEEKTWSQDVITLLKLAGNAIANALERKRVEEALRESEEQYRSIYETALVGLWRTGINDGKFLKANLTAAKMLGYATIDDLMEDCMASELYSPERRAEFLEKLKEQGEVSGFEAHFKLKNGTEKDITVSAKIYPESGYIEGAIIDITGRKRAEVIQLVLFRIAQATSKAKNMEELLAIIHQQVATLMDAGNFYVALYHKGSGIYSFPYLVDEYDSVDFFPHELSKSLTDYVRRTGKPLLADEQTHRSLIKAGEVEMVGTPSPIWMGVPLKTANKVIGVVSVQSYTNPSAYTERDLEILSLVSGSIAVAIERKKAEEKHRESEERFRLVTELSPFPISIIDPQGRYLYVNKKFTETFGYSLKDMPNGGEWFKLAYPDPEYRRKVISTWKSDLEESSTGLARPRTFSVKCKNGTIREILFRSVTMNNDRQFIIYEDITERKQLEEERIKASKLESIGILAGGIAHDFNNILAAILGYINMANIVKDNTIKVNELLTAAEENVLRAKGLTQQLLTFAKGGAPNKATTSVSELIKEITSFSMTGSNVSCRFDIAENLWPADIDEVQISQVFNNLIINAVQAMPEGGTIEVRAENIVLGTEVVLPLNAGNYIKISIKDQGVGIPKKHLPKIFDPYFTTKQKGSGLGLTSSYSIIKKHEGHITVESELGAGTTFHIYLPARPGKIVQKKEAEPGVPFVSGRILVMDDDEILRDAISRILVHFGNEVEDAGDGTEAIEKYKKAKDNDRPFDVVIMDLTIQGGLGGKETIRKMLEMDSNAKVIVSSGYSDDPVLSDFRKYGFVGATPKPYNYKELLKLLNNVILGMVD